MDRVFKQGVEGLTPNSGTCPNDFSNPTDHPVCSELENSGIRVGVSDCSDIECRRWRPPYQTSKTVNAKTLQT